MMPQATFRRMVAIEQRRSERSARPFAILWVEAGRVRPISGDGHIWQVILPALEVAMRDTDLIGWQETGAVAGVVLTEITPDDGAVLESILSRIEAGLQTRLSVEERRQIRFSCELFPETMRRIEPASERDEEFLSFAAHGNSGGRGPRSR
jgi:hypothetical protein